jgi:AcrR family transcriptional regulator
VAIDRAIIEHAGVARAARYNAFGSQEEVARACLRAGHDATRESMSRELQARCPTASERLAGVCEVTVVYRSGIPRVRAGHCQPRSGRPAFPM